MNTSYVPKNSTLPVLDYIPYHWKEIRSKYLLEERDDRSSDGNEDLLSVSQYTGVTKKRKQISGSNDSRASSLEGYKQVDQDNLVINIMLAWNGSLGVSKYQGIVSPAYGVYKINNVVYPTYLHYLVKSEEYKTLFRMYSTGVIDSRLRLYSDQLFSLRFIVPSYTEQEQIARYLDYKNHLFNKYIRIKKKQIELLKELKQVVINDAVTGKIDVRTGKPYPKYKDSGVEWIGMIPEEWTCKRLKELSKIVLGKMLKPVKSEGDVLKPYLRSTNIQWLLPNVSDVNSMWFTPRELSLYRLSKNDILVSEGGEVGRACIWDDELLECYIQNSVHKITTNQDILPLYLLYSFTEKASKGFFKAFVNRVSIGHLTREKIVSIPFIVPPPETQESIIKFLAKIDQRTELTLSLYLSQITTIKELQTRLISDVVTGKLDVRSIEIPDFEEEPEELDEEIIDDSIEDAANAD